MPADLDLTVPATTRGLASVLQALQDACAARSVEESLVSRARIVIEELFTNTIKYGYGGERDRPVRFSLTVDGALTLTLEDEAPAFDPTMWRPSTTVFERPTERPVGQAGIAMVMGLSSKVTHQALPIGNRVTVVVAARGA
jgi:serine/threonine-protein kinase RsbW